MNADSKDIGADLIQELRLTQAIVEDMAFWAMKVPEHRDLAVRQIKKLQAKLDETYQRQSFLMLALKTEAGILAEEQE